MKHVLFVMMAMVAAGCGKADFNGTFKGQQVGTQNGQAVNQTVTLILSESGSAVAGTWTSTAGTSGTMSGTKADSELKDIAMTWSGCTGTGTGTGKIDGSKFTATGNGTFICNGVQVLLISSFDLSRQ